jgi:hypothetical protein
MRLCSGSINSFRVRGHDGVRLKPQTCRLVLPRFPKAREGKERTILGRPKSPWLNLLVAIDHGDGFRPAPFARGR